VTSSDGFTWRYLWIEDKPYATRLQAAIARFLLSTDLENLNCPYRVCILDRPYAGPRLQRGISGFRPLFCWASTCRSDRAAFAAVMKNAGGTRTGRR
jgi:hypothetical protein